MGAISSSIGIENGNYDFRKNTLNRKYKNKDVLNAFRIIKKHRIKTHSFNMIGLPGEERHHINDTINLNRLVRPDTMQVSIFYPFVGTDLYEKCVNENLINIEESHNKTYYENTILNYSSKKKGDIYKLSKLIPLYSKYPTFLLFLPKLFERYDYIFLNYLTLKKHLNSVIHSLKYYINTIKTLGVIKSIKKLKTKL